MKISVTEIVTIFISIGAYTVMDLFTGIRTALGNLHITYAEPFLVFISAVAGPISGAITGCIGQLIIQVREGDLDWPMTICAVLTCILIGFFTRSIEIKKGVFEKKEMASFNKVQILTNFLIWALAYPALTFFFTRTDLFNTFRMGFYIAVHNIISCTLLSTLFLAVYARTRMTPETFYRN